MQRWFTKRMRPNLVHQMANCGYETVMNTTLGIIDIQNTVK